MKLLAQILLFFSCTLCAQTRLQPIHNNIVQTKRGIFTKDISSYAALVQYKCINPNMTTCPTKIKFCRGPKGPKGNRGHHGRRGHTGATGATGITGATGSAALCGLNSLFINAPMMSDQFSANPDVTFNNVYGPSTSSTTPTITAWDMLITDFPQSPKTMQFIIPDDMDTTQPITLTIHCFNNFNVEAIGSVAFQVQADYKSNGQEIGTSLPATGFSETLTTPDHLVVDPTGFGVDQANIRYFTLSVPLTGALIAGNTWAYLAVGRVAPAAGFDYSESVYFTAISIDYTRICQPLP